jgi:8-oxo-dGTP pyrophosphatase MutT (NUDIX family)
MEDFNPWQIKGEKAIYRNNWIAVTEYDVINPSGGKGIYGKVHFQNTAVGVVVLDDENNTYLVGQYRFPLNAYSWEIPEGGAAADADPQAECERELLEETGLKANHWQRILKMHLSNSVSDELAFIYLATGLSQHAASPEETEALTIKKMPFEEAYQMVLRGHITDSMSVAAILKVKILLTEAGTK